MSSFSVSINSRLVMALENTYVTADLHFGHKNIIEYEIRPFNSVEDMDERLISNWNSALSNKEKIFVLGDFSFYNKERTAEIVRRLNGRKVLVLGNHDRSHSIKWWYDIGFSEVYKYPIVFKDFFMMSHEPPFYTPPNSPYIYVYGHVHSNEIYKTITKTSCCVSVERWEYKPITLDRIVNLIKELRLLN
jgi:calcineurin-like phosphoesterase family protein